jgi:hypothetical protein
MMLCVFTLMVSSLGYNIGMEKYKSEKHDP